MKKTIFVILLLSMAYAGEISNFAKDWIGIYESNIIQNDKQIKQSFEIMDNCYNDDGMSGDMSGFWCEIGYSKNGSKFDNFKTNFYTEKPNDKNYAMVRIIVLHSTTKATIQAFSMEYANDFCNIKVEKHGNIINLKYGEYKIDDFTMHNEILVNI